jgi:predicted protein tyrosine phosphatase
LRIHSFQQKIKIVGIAEAVRLSPSELTGWNILSIRARMNDQPLTFPGARRTKTLRFDDVQGDDPGEFAATPEDIQVALAFSREVKDEPLLIHCAAGISRSTAMAWIIVYEKLKGKPDAVRRSFDIVRKLRPILAPNRHVLRLGIEALVPQENREAVKGQFRDCLIELNQGNAVAFPGDADEQAAQ